jgi:hypothetical protein
MSQLQRRDVEIIAAMVCIEINQGRRCSKCGGNKLVRGPAMCKSDTHGDMPHAESKTLCEDCHFQWIEPCRVCFPNSVPKIIGFYGEEV